jgi:hypothetical protein
MSSAARYSVDPRLATLLGEGYRSTEKALKELIDNAWDADADRVTVQFPTALTTDPIVISDDGSGMTEFELRKEYLSIANDRRSRKGERSRKNRLVKGRKGIGKFAGFMAAEVMEIDTRARGVQTRLTIYKEDLLRSGADLEDVDLSLEVMDCDPKDHGTTVTLSQLNQNFSLPNVEFFKQLLILEYGRSEQFEIIVNGSPLDIRDLPGEEFAHEAVLPGVGPVRLRFKVSDGKQALKHSGIAVRAGGKIVGEPIYFGLQDDDEIPPKLLKKVYGEIEADGLIDGVTADWGAIIENSLPFRELEPWVREHVRSGVEHVYKKEVRDTRARLQREIQRRIELMPEYRRRYAEAALQGVMKKFYGEKIERIEAVASVVLDALERDEYYVVVEKLHEARSSDVQALAEALEEFGLVDLAVIGQQARGRLRFLDEFDALINDPSTLEKQVHQAVDKNLWVFGPEYALMSSNKTTRRAIQDYADQEFTGDRANKRPDLLLANGLDRRYLLVEFKRPSHAITRDDVNQAEKYRDDLTGTFGRMSIQVIGKERSSQMPAHYDQADIQIRSYADVVSTARRQLEWLLEQLGNG